MSTSQLLARNSVYLNPIAFRSPLPLSTRLLMRVTFDRPLAQSPTPEPHWAVGLSLTPGGDLSGRTFLIVTCQFRREHNGIRLATPSAVQKDVPALLESPLDYRYYHDGIDVDPSGAEVHPGPPRFTLEHYFSSWNADTIKHTVGSGSLRIAHRHKPESVDHRVYSSTSLTPAANPATPNTPPIPVGALGVLLGTGGGSALLSVRLRSFSLSFNEAFNPRDIAPAILSDAAECAT